MDNIVKGDNILVFEFLHKGNLADRRTRGSLFGIQMNLLERDELASLTVAALENLEGYRKSKSVTTLGLFKKEQAREGRGGESPLTVA